MGDTTYTHTDYNGDKLTANPVEEHPGVWVRVNGSVAVEVCADRVPALAEALYRAAKLEWPAKTCGGFYSPGPETRYTCSRMKGHPGPCLDDQLSVLWISSWGEDSDRYTILDTRRPYDRTSAPEPAPLRLGERVVQLEKTMGQIAKDMGDRQAHMEYHDELTRRLENLEQTSAGGAAVDDMFAVQSRRLDALEDRLVSGERLGDIVNLLAEIRDRLPAPPPEPCGSISPNQLYECDLPIGHTGRHEFSHGSYKSSWPDGPGARRCHGRLTIGGTIRCTLLDGHDGAHQNATQGARWPNPCREDAMCKLSAGHPGTHQLTDL